MPLPRLPQGNTKVFPNPCRIPAQNHHPVRQQHRLFDVVRYQENTFGRNLFLQPQLQQLAA